MTLIINILTQCDFSNKIPNNTPPSAIPATGTQNLTENDYGMR